MAKLALGVTVLAFSIALTDAQDRHETGVKRGQNLEPQRLVGLAKQLAPLRVAEDHAVHVEFGQHRCRNLTGERTGLSLVHRLREDLYARAARRVDHRRQRSERRTFSRA